MIGFIINIFILYTEKLSEAGEEEWFPQSHIDDIAGLPDFKACALNASLLRY